MYSIKKVGRAKNPCLVISGECQAPIEQYLRKHKPGEYTDIYVLTATLYFLLTSPLPKYIDRYHTQ